MHCSFKPASPALRNAGNAGSHVRTGRCHLPPHGVVPLPRRCTVCWSDGSSPAGGSGDSAQRKKKAALPGFLKPLTDFGIGKNSVWQGGVGLFIVFGAGVAGMLAVWVSGMGMRRGRGYECTVQFPEACSITTGTPVRLRGIQVGSVLSVQPHLDRVDVLIEIDDESTPIPTNSRIFANQSGLIAEPLVDIMPQQPIPEIKSSPLATECLNEGTVVCHKGLIHGEKGVALDDLVYTSTQLMRQVDGGGMAQFTATAETLNKAITDAQPLVDASTGLVEQIDDHSTMMYNLVAVGHTCGEAWRTQVTPLLRELREAGLVKQVEGLATLATETAGDIRDLQKAVLDGDNVNELRKSVKTLTKTLQHIESIAGEVSAMSTDSSAVASLRQLIEAFSRLVAD